MISGYLNQCVQFERIALGGLRATRTLLPSVWAAAAAPVSVLTAAWKLKGLWTLGRLLLPMLEDGVYLGSTTLRTCGLQTAAAHRGSGPPSGLDRTDKAELLKCSDSIIKTNLFRNLAVRDP